MGIYYSAMKQAFYDSDINLPMPADVVAISDALHVELLEALYSGGSISIDANGAPIAVAAPALTLAQVQGQLCGQIDATADEVYMAIGGPSPGRLAEYQQAKSDAQTFKTAGYSGTVPETVQCWATAKAWTAQQAADDILATAAAWESVLVAIRSARLSGKASVGAATDIPSAKAAAATAVTNVQACAAGA
jgi:hypothetical protein